MVPVVNPLLYYKKKLTILRSIGMSTRQSDLEVALGDTVKIIEGAFSGEGVVTKSMKKNKN